MNGGGLNGTLPSMVQIDDHVEPKEAAALQEYRTTVDFRRSISEGLARWMFDLVPVSGSRLEGGSGYRLAYCFGEAAVNFGTSS